MIKLKKAIILFMAFLMLACTSQFVLAADYQAETAVLSGGAVVEGDSVKISQSGGKIAFSGLPSTATTVAIHYRTTANAKANLNFNGQWNANIGDSTTVTTVKDPKGAYSKTTYYISINSIYNGQTIWIDKISVDPSGTGDTTAPTVNLTAPAGGATLSGNTIISAIANDNVRVSRVEFYYGTTLIATDTTSPYSVTWNTSAVANGSYSLTAKAYDTSGNWRISAARGVTVFNDSGDTTAPTVALTAPASGATVTGNVTVSATASDDVGVSRVEFYHGTILIATDTTTPYSVTWATSAVANGSYSLTAKAYDAAGNVGTSPVINVTVNNAPAPGLTVHFKNNSITNWSTINCYFWGSNGSPAANAWPGQTMTADGNGWYSFVIPAATTSNVIFGNGSTQSVDLSRTGEGWWVPTGISGGKVIGTWYNSNPDGDEDDTTAPTVALTAPADSASVSGSSVTISANASDNVGVSKVEFYHGTTLIATDNTAPYSISWDTTTLANNSYSLTAKAYDAANNVGTSATRNVTVNNGPSDTVPPTISITAPAGGATVSGNAVAISASANDNVGVSRVEFYYGTTIIATDNSAPYSISWNTKAVANGSYNLTAKAYDAAGNVGSSAAVNVTVSNEELPGLTVHFKRPDNWGNSIRIHYWNILPATVPNSGAWPGLLMTDDGDGWYSYTVAGATGMSVIFNDGSGRQTADLSRANADGWYYSDNQWYDQCPEGPSVFASPAGESFSADTITITLGATGKGLVSIRYSLDGTNPATGGIPYVNGATITIGGDMTVGDTKTLRLYASDGTQPFEQTYTYSKIEPPYVDNTSFNNLRIYQVMVESFQDGDPNRNYNTGYGPSHHRGDLKGIKEALPYIKSLGVNALWMTPIFNSNGSSQLDATGYFCQNYFEVDPKFGTFQDAKDLVDEAHRLGMYVFLDGVFGHHKGSVPPSPSGYYPAGGNNPVSYPASLNFYREVATWWIDQLEIDGWRLDQAYQVPVDAWKSIREAVEAKCNERKSAGKHWGTLGYMVGEIWKGELDIQREGYGPDHAPGLRSCFDFPLRYSLVTVLATKEHIEESNPSRQPASALNNGYATHNVYADHAYPNLMITNHDLVRFGDLLQRAGYGGKENPDYWKRHKAAFSFLSSYTGPITIYYGDEIGDEVPGFVYQGDLGYYDDHVSRSSGQISGFNAEQQDLKDYVTQLMNLRAAHPALWNGTRTNLRADTYTFVDYKVDGEDKMIYALNTGSSTMTISVSQTQVGGSLLVDGLTGAKIQPSGGSYSFSLDGLTGRFLIVE